MSDQVLSAFTLAIVLTTVAVLISSCGTDELSAEINISQVMSYPVGPWQPLITLYEPAPNIFTDQADKIHKIHLNPLAAFAIMEMFPLHEERVAADNNADLGK